MGQDKVQSGNPPLDRSARSTRNGRPIYNLDKLFPKARLPARPKKLTAKRYAFISDFFRTVALPNVAKFGGRGEGRRLWRRELLKGLKIQDRSRGTITSADLNCWLENGNLAQFVKTLEGKRSAWSSNGSGSSRGHQTSPKLKTLTDTRAEVISALLQNAKARGEAEKYARSSNPKEAWKKDLRQKLNQLPWSKRKGCAISDADLEHWLRDPAFQTAIDELGSAVNRVIQKADNSPDAADDGDEVDSLPFENEDAVTVVEAPDVVESSAAFSLRPLVLAFVKFEDGVFNGTDTAKTLAGVDQATGVEAVGDSKEELEVKVRPPLPPLSPDMGNYLPDAEEEDVKPEAVAFMSKPSVQEKLKKMKECTETLRSLGQGLADEGMDLGIVASYYEVVGTVSSFVDKIPEFTERPLDKAWTAYKMDKPRYG